MEQMGGQHLIPFNTLSEGAKEFIASFEEVQNKMTAWRQELTQQATSQEAQMMTIKTELDRMQQIISEASLECFRMAAEETLSQGKDYLNGLKNTEQQLLRQIHDHRAELTRITQHALTLITQKTSQMTAAIDEKLSSPDPYLLKSMMHQQTVPVDVPSSKDLPQEEPTPKYIEWRAVTLTLVTSLVTALVFGLYTTDEYPWEMHQQASSERGAGKVLLNAWPSLTHHEKNKILYRAS